MNIKTVILGILFAGTLMVAAPEKGETLTLTREQEETMDSYTQTNRELKTIDGFFHRSKVKTLNERFKKAKNEMKSYLESISTVEYTIRFSTMQQTMHENFSKLSGRYSEEFSGNFLNK